MNDRYLIVNADDYGLHKSSDAAVEQLFAAGMITSTTILAPARYAAAACQTAAARGYHAGVHWTLYSEWAEESWQPCADAKSISTVCKDGCLYNDAKMMAKTAKSREVTHELEAQYLYVLSHGCKPDHADSHGGTLYGLNGRLFFMNAFRICKKYKLPFRFPKRPQFIERQMGRSVGRVLKIAHQAIVTLAAIHGVPLLDDLVTNPWPVAKIGSYDALREYYDRTLSNCLSGVIEVFLHPSVIDNEMTSRIPEWRKREWENRYLGQGDFMKLVEREGFKLCHWGNAPFR